MEYNSGSNWASNFKSAEREVRGRFEITSTITPELYDTKSYYQLIVSMTKCMKLFVVCWFVFFTLKALEINSAEQVVKF